MRPEKNLENQFLICSMEYIESIAMIDDCRTSTCLYGNFQKMWATYENILRFKANASVL